MRKERKKVRLSCSDSLIYTGLHTFRRHASPPRAPADGVDRTLVRSSREFFFKKSCGQIIPSGSLKEDSSLGYATRQSKPIRFYLKILRFVDKPEFCDSRLCRVAGSGVQESRSMQPRFKECQPSIYTCFGLMC